MKWQRYLIGVFVTCLLGWVLLREGLVGSGATGALAKNVSSLDTLAFTASEQDDPLTRRVLPKVGGRPTEHDLDTDHANGLELVGHIGGWTRAVAVQGSYAYIGEGSQFTVLHISAPAAPRMVGKTLPLEDVVYGVAVVGNYAYVAAGRGGLYIVDVSDPTEPVEVGSCPTWMEPGRVTVDGKYAYITVSNGLWVGDVSNPADPVQVGLYDAPGGQDGTGVSVSGGYVLLTFAERGLYVFTTYDETWGTARTIYLPVILESYRR